MKIKKSLVFCLSLSILLSSIGILSYADEGNSAVVENEGNIAKAEDNLNKVIRISGEDRYDTSLEVAKKLEKIYGKKSEYNIYASGDDFSDALTAGMLAGEYKSPLILVSRDSVSSKVKENISKDKKKAYLIGGKKSVSENVESVIKENSQNLERIWGPERLDTAVYVAKQQALHRGQLAIGDISNVYNGYNFADALTATPYLYQNYKDESSIVATIPYSKGRMLRTNIIFGGYSSVPKFEDEEYRLAGDDRYKTAVEVAKAYKTRLNKDIDTVVITSGEDYPDALSAGPLAISKDAAILLTTPNTLNKDTEDYLKSNKNIKNIIIVGGENSVSKEVEKQLMDIIN